jgi:hypothetical protein
MRLTLIKRSTFQKEEIHFFTGRDKKVIGRASCGKFAVVSFDYRGLYVRDGDDWLCEIIKDEENRVIVFPLERIKSAEENYAETLKKVGELKSTGFQKKFFKPKNADFKFRL